MGSEAAQAIPGMEGAVNPFWSPNSEWLAFQTLNAWYRVKIPGGAPETITAFRGYTSNASSSAWGDDVIVFSGVDGALFRVSVQGGQPSQLTTLEPSTKERAHSWPQFLSDGRHFLYLASGDHGRVFLDSVDGGQRSLVMEMQGPGSTIRYVPGYLFYVENMVLWAHPFDESSRRLIGERRRVVAGLATAGKTGVTPFSVSRTGVLAHWTQSVIQQAAQLQWMDRKGNRLGLVGSSAVYDGFDLSRNESQLVLRGDN
jgi:Tol biopolymer transport system component